MAGSSSHPSSPESITAIDYIQNQLELEQQAREVMPYDPNHCTYHDEPVRQQVYACLTCAQKNGSQNGVCYSCSIQCHSDHTVVELMTKRNFTCDCGTRRIKSFGGCNLRKNFDSLDPEGASNVYTHNNDGKFCVCGSTYDERETSIMFQCLLGDVCGEDWYHEECILGIPRSEAHKYRPKPRAKTYPQGVNVLESLPEVDDTDDHASAHHENDDDEDDTMEGLPNQSEFDAFVCWRCIDKHRQVFDKIKSVGIVVERNPVKEEKEKEEKEKEDDQEEGDQEEEGPAKKRLKTTKVMDYSLFLPDNYEQKIAKLQQEDPEVGEFVSKFEFFVKEEPVYEPPPDDDAASSLLDAGAQALRNLPRDQALDGMQAYAKIKDKLTQFLRPFAEQGKVVTEGDINDFFGTMESKQ